MARLVMYLAVCLSTLVLRRRQADGRHGRRPVPVPLGPVVPMLASIVALGILAGATGQQLTAGAAALVAGAILFLIATRTGRTGHGDTETQRRTTL